MGLGALRLEPATWTLVTGLTDMAAGQFVKILVQIAGSASGRIPVTSLPKTLEDAFTVDPTDVTLAFYQPLELDRLKTVQLSRSRQQAGRRGGRGHKSARSVACATEKQLLFVQKNTPLNAKAIAFAAPQVLAEEATCATPAAQSNCFTANEGCTHTLEIYREVTLNRRKKSVLLREHLFPDVAQVCVGGSGGSSRQGNSGRELAGPSVEQVMAEWNATPNTRQCLCFSTSRRRALASRLKTPLWRERWLEGLTRIGQSQYFRERPPDMDWFLRDGSLLAILEGKYDQIYRAQRRPAESRGEYVAGG